MPGKPAEKDSPGKENIPPRKPEKKTPEAMGDECSKEPPKDTQPKRQTCKPGVLRSSQEGLMILNFLLDSTNEPSTGEGEVALARIKAIIRRLSTKQCMHALLRKDTITHRAFGSQPVKRNTARYCPPPDKPIWQQSGMDSQGLNLDQLELLEELRKLTKSGTGLIKVDFPETKRTLVEFELSPSQTKSDFCCEPPVNPNPKKLMQEWETYDLRREAAKEIKRMAREEDIVCPGCEKQVGTTSRTTPTSRLATNRGWTSPAG